MLTECLKVSMLTVEVWLQGIAFQRHPSILIIYFNKKKKKKKTAIDAWNITH